MDLVIRAEGKCLKQLGYHPPIVPAVGVTDHRAQGSTIGWPGGLPFFNEIAQSLLTDYRINDFSYNPFGIRQRRIGELKEQILFASYRFKSSSNSRSTFRSARAPMW